MLKIAIFLISEVKPFPFPDPPILPAMKRGKFKSP